MKNNVAMFYQLGESTDDNSKKKDDSSKSEAEKSEKTTSKLIKSIPVYYLLKEYDDKIAFKNIKYG